MCPSPSRKGRLPGPDPLALRPYEATDGPVVLGWLSSDDEARRWASLPARPADPAILTSWHEAPGVRAYVAHDAAAPVAYGEIWEDADAHEAELARLIVDPTSRGQGIGRAFVSGLLAEARRLGWDDVWLRVVPDNEPALRAYSAAGFRRAGSNEEAAFNKGQPVAYVWLRAPR